MRRMGAGRCGGNDRGGVGSASAGERWDRRRWEGCTPRQGEGGGGQGRSRTAGVRGGPSTRPRVKPLRDWHIAGQGMPPRAPTVCWQRMRYGERPGRGRPRRRRRSRAQRAGRRSQAVEGRRLEGRRVHRCGRSRTDRAHGRPPSPPSRCPVGAALPLRLQPRKPPAPRRWLLAQRPERSQSNSQNPSSQKFSETH